MSDPERLGTLLSHRDQDSQKVLLSFLYVFWGVFDIVGIWINSLVWYSTVFWAFWIPTGIVLMSALIYWKIRGRLGRTLWDREIVPRIWISNLIVLPLFIWAFPEVFHLYSHTWIFPITSAWVALSMYATGVFTKRLSISLGSLAFWLTAPLYLVWPDFGPALFTGANVLGLVIPGLVSSYGERS